MDACERREEQISALLDGELSETERQELAEHLAGCAACRAYLADLTAIQEAMETVPAPEGFTRSVMDRVAGTDQTERKKRVPWGRWGLLAACCVLAALGLWQFQAGGPRMDAAILPAGAARGAAAEDWDETAAEDVWAAEAALPAAQADYPAVDGSYTEDQAVPAEGAPTETEGVPSSDGAPLLMSPSAKVTLSLWETLPRQFVLEEGGWYTELTVQNDGSFTGFTRESGGKDALCRFRGTFGEPEAVDGYTYRTSLETLTVTDGDSAPYGLENAGTLLLCLPGTPPESLPEALRTEGALECCMLCNVEAGSGFVSAKGS